MTGRRRAAAALAAALALAGRAARASEGDDALRALKEAVKVEAPEARAAEVRAASRALARAPDALRRKAAIALRKALESDPSSPVRREVVRALSRLRDEAAWIPVLHAAVADRDPEVVLAARRAVSTSGADVVPVVSRLAKEDEDPAFRAEMLLLLGTRRKADAAADALVAALGDDHPRVVAAAAEALEAVSGEPLGTDAAAWKAWLARRPAPEPSPEGETVTVETPLDPEPPPPAPPPRGLVPTFFGLPLDAKDVVFVLDVSGSVGEAGFAKAKGELLRAVEGLASDVRFGALFFDEQVRFWRPDLVRASPVAKGELALFLRGVPRGKRTDVTTALNAGLQILRTRSRERREGGEATGTPVTMVLVSDGVETVRGTPLDTVADKLERLALEDAVVHCVVLGGKDSALMAAVARRTGGRYLVAP
jgi:hypothetical protein